MTRRKEQFRKIRAAGDLSYCRRCGSVNVGHVWKNGTDQIIGLYCRECLWSCGEVDRFRIFFDKTEETILKARREIETWKTKS